MLEVKNLVKVYSAKGGVTVRALDDVSVKFPEKGMVFLLGRSGSGKSTLLNVAGGLDKPDSGEVIVKGRSSKDFSGSDFDSYRNTCVGFVFQEYNILNEFTIEQNISLALQLQNKKNDKAAVNALLEMVDLKGFGKRKPNTLSGGQKQRVAIARALIKEPEIIMADEPTGALDSNTGKQVLDTLKKLSKTKLVIIVSHDREFAEFYADRIIELKDGKILEDVTKTYSEPKSVSENVQMVSDDTVSIKNAENITESDVKNIVAMLKKNGGEAIITASKRDLKDVKRAVKINEDGTQESFKETKGVETKEYDGKKTKFIKSHLPASHAFKIGASGLKTKPVRLVFTILLSVVAFVMFGVVSAFMLYDANYSVSSALQEANYPTVALKNQYIIKNMYLLVNVEDGTVKEDSGNEDKQNTLFSQEEIDELNKNNCGLKFAGVFGLTDYETSYSMLPSVSVNSDYFPVTNFCGFSDCGETFLLTENGFNRVSGRYPAAADEIAVSNYVEELYKKQGKTTAVGETVKINANGYELSLKIVGVYNVGEIDSKYDSLKTESTTLTQKEKKERESLKNSLADMLNLSFYTTAFVSENFYETNYKGSGFKDYGSGIYSAYSSGINIFWGEYSGTVDKYSGNSIYTDTQVKYNKNAFEFYDLDGNPLTVDKDNLGLGVTDVYAPMADYSNEYLNALRDMSSNTTWAIINAIQQIVNIESNKFLDAARNNPLYGTDDDYRSWVDRYSSYYTNFYDATSLMETQDAYNAIKGKVSEDTFAGINLSYVSGNSETDTLAYQLWQVYTNNDFERYNFTEFMIIAKPAIENDYTAMTSSPVPKEINFKYAYDAEGAELSKYSRNFYDAYSIPEADKVKIKNAVIADYERIMNTQFKIAETEREWQFKNYNNMTGKFNVKGYYKIVGNGYYSETLLVSDAFLRDYAYQKEYSFNCSSTDYVRPESLKYTSAISKTDNTQEQIAFVLSEDVGNGEVRYIDNEVYGGLQMFITMIESLNKAFLIVGCVVGGLAALMLLNFISASISAKSKEIGILRAVGARGTDVFKIFFSEAFIIAMICFVLAAVGAGFVCNIVNNSVTQLEMIQTSKLLDYNLINIGLIFLISMVISAIATFFPVFSASRKSPVESIRAL